DAESVQLYYEIALQGREDLALAPDAHAGFVMTLLRMLAFRPEGASRDRIILEKTKASTPSADKSWPELARQLPVTGAARELARNAELRRREGGLFELAVPKEKAYLADRNYQDKLQAALEQHLGSGVTVKVAVGETSGASPAAIENGEREARRAEAAGAGRPVGRGDGEGADDLQVRGEAGHHRSFAGRRRSRDAGGSRRRRVQRCLASRGSDHRREDERHDRGPRPARGIQAAVLSGQGFASRLEGPGAARRGVARSARRRTALGAAHGVPSAAARSRRRRSAGAGT